MAPKKKKGDMTEGKLPYSRKMRGRIRASMTARREGGEFTSVRNWYREFTKRTGSEGTKDVYARLLAMFSNHMGMEPDEIVAEAIEKGYEIGRVTWAENTVDDFMLYMEQELGYARKTASQMYGTLRGFFRSNGVIFVKKTPPQWAETRIQPPVKDDLVEIRNAANLKGRLAIDLANSLGWRRSDLVRLTYAEIKEGFDKGDKRLYVAFRSKKEEVWAANIIGKEATESLRLYFRTLEESGIEIADGTPLIGKLRDPTKPMTPDQFTMFLGSLGKAVGKSLMPTHFRKRFRTIVEGIIGTAATKRMGGWKLEGVGEMYYLPDRGETLRLYLQIEPALSLTGTSQQADAGLDALRAVAKVYGIDPMKIRIASEDMSREDEVARITAEITRAREEELRALRMFKEMMKE